MIRIRTKVDGWSVLTTQQSEKWITIAHKKGMESRSSSEVSFMAAAQKHLEIAGSLIPKKKDDEKDSASKTETIPEIIQGEKN